MHRGVRRLRSRRRRVPQCPLSGCVEASRRLQPLPVATARSWDARLGRREALARLALAATSPASGLRRPGVRRDPPRGRPPRYRARRDMNLRSPGDRGPRLSGLPSTAGASPLHGARVVDASGPSRWVLAMAPPQLFCITLTPGPLSPPITRRLSSSPPRTAAPGPDGNGIAEGPPPNCSPAYLELPPIARDDDMPAKPGSARTLARTDRRARTRWPSQPRSG